MGSPLGNENSTLFSLLFFQTLIQHQRSCNSSTERVAASAYSRAWFRSSQNLSHGTLTVIYTNVFTSKTLMWFRLNSVLRKKCTAKGNLRCLAKIPYYILLLIIHLISISREANGYRER